VINFNLNLSFHIFCGVLGISLSTVVHQMYKPISESPDRFSCRLPHHQILGKCVEQFQTRNLRTDMHDLLICSFYALYANGSYFTDRVVRLKQNCSWCKKELT